MEGKWFAEQLEHAKKWGLIFYMSGDHWIVEVEIPDETSRQLFGIKMLDGIGPAKYVEEQNLDKISFVAFYKIS